MKSRTMLTAAGLLILTFVGVLAHGLLDQQANAQRFNAPSQPPQQFDSPATIRAPANLGTSSLSEPQAYSPQYDSQPAALESAPMPVLSAQSTHPIIVAVKDGPQLNGNPVNLGAFEFQTIFGRVSIPVHTIVGIRMAEDPHEPATICLSNGDSLTGVLSTPSVTITTTWGGATIGRDHIISIVTTTDPVSWQEHEGRWQLKADSPALEGRDAVE